MSQEIQEQLHKQQEVIADKQMSVKEDLDKVEPAVIEAQNGRPRVPAHALPKVSLVGPVPVSSGTVPVELVCCHQSKALPLEKSDKISFMLTQFFVMILD